MNLRALRCYNKIETINHVFVDDQCARSLIWLKLTIKFTDSTNFKFKY